MEADENRIQKTPTPFDSICSCKSQKSLHTDSGTIDLDYGCVFQQSSGCRDMAASR